MQLSIIISLKAGNPLNKAAQPLLHINARPV